MNRELSDAACPRCGIKREARPESAVDHPAHYTSDPSGIECIQIVRHRNFNIGNAIKYLWRAGLKDETKHIEDLRKAVFYINDEITRLETRGNGGAVGHGLGY